MSATVSRRVSAPMAGVTISARAAPVRPDWREFCRVQAKTMQACESFTVDTVLLPRTHVFFVIEVGTPRVHILGATRHPTGQL